MVDEEIEFSATNSECLLIWRKRNHFSQIQAAAARGVTVDLYRLQEAGFKASSQVMLGGFKKREICLLKRRRMGWSQNELAEVLGVTKLWVLRMENGTAPVARLYNYWTD